MSIVSGVGLQVTGTHFKAPVALLVLALTVGAGSWSPPTTGNGISPMAPTAIAADTPPIHDATVGAVAGESSTEGGASAYRIPISVPPGRAGLQPDVALVYSSRGGNGLAGVGWSLSATSAIQRCPQTMEQDGRTRGVSFDAEDRLCLNGQRLLRVSGSAYGQNGAEYRTEIDSFARVTQVGGDLTGSAACFRVEQKSGRFLHYGAVTSGGSCAVSARNARVLPAGAAGTLSWMVEKDEDRVGNNVFYSYVNYGNGEVLPLQIDYTGFGAGVGDRSVRMAYQARPASSSASVYHADIASSYLDGGLTMQTQRLVRVDTYESTTSRVGSWKLDYQNTTSRYTGRSLVRAINQCNTVAGVETCFSLPTTFDYQDRTPRYAFKALAFSGLPASSWTATDALAAQAAMQSQQAAQLAELGFSGRGEPPLGDVPAAVLADTALGSVLGFSTIADFDGDGARESFARVQASTGPRGYLLQAMATRLLRSAVDMTGQVISPTEFDKEVADIDGDGRADLLVYTNPLSFGVWNAAPGALPGSPVFRSVSTTIPSGGLLGSQFFARLADFDGDAKPDIATFAPHASCGSDSAGNKNGVFLHRNNLPDGPVGTTAAFIQGTNPLFCLARAASGPFGETGEFVERVADFDGDGLPDFFITSTTGSSGGTRTFERIVLTRYSGGVFSAVSLSATSLGLSTDERSRAQSKAAHWIDVNGDGLDDYVFGQSQASGGSPTPTGVWLVRLNQGGSLSASINTGNGTGLKTTSGSNTALRYANRLPQMDIDSDGRIDLLTPRAFAARVCAYSTREPPQPSECPGGINGFGQCVEYLCPEAPDSDNLGMGGQMYGGQQIKPLYGQNQASLDQSSYLLNALRFVQTGPASIVVQVVPTDIVASLDRQAPEDTYGDSVPDLITEVGCKYGSVGAGGAGFEPCMLVADDVYGPSTLPNGESLLTPNSGGTSYYFENHNKTYISEGRGSLSPAYPVDGAVDVGLPRIGDMVQNVVDGMDNWTAWRYRTLSADATYGWGIPFYSVPATAAGRYSDARHYYFTSTMPVVQVMTQSTGAVDKEDPTIAIGSRSFFYAYREAMYNRLGRGFQGFRGIVELSLLPDTRAKQVVTTFHQKFPLTSQVESVEVSPMNRLTLPLQRETNTWRCTRANRGGCPSTPGFAAPSIPQTTVYAPFLDTQVTQNYDDAATQAYSSALVSTQTTVNASSGGATSSGWDAYGNLANQVVTTADGGTGGSFVSSQVTSTSRNYTIDAANWWVDKLDNQSVSSSIAYAAGHTLPSPCTAGVCTPLRTVGTSYVWNADRTPQSQTVQGGIFAQEQITSYQYASPSYGLPTMVSVGASNATPTWRSTTISYSKDGTSVAADGYFPLQTTNPLLQTTTTERRPRDGQVSRLIAPTLLQTITQFDPFGRPRQVDYKATNGSTLEPSTYISLTRCSTADGSCPGGYGEGTGQTFAAVRTTTIKDGTPTQVAWHDKRGRPVKQAVRGLDGSFNQTLSVYDPAGSIIQQSMPHSPGGAVYWTTYSGYDHLDRPSQKIAPGAEMDATNGDVVTQYSYSGAKTSIKVRAASASASGACAAGALCMDMERYHDSLGRLVKTVQNLGPTANYAVTRYWFDGPGNAVLAQDAENNLIRATYDALGRRSTMVDPDAGTWGFAYDGFGQMLTQTDARSITTTMAYDALGRMATRSSTNPGGGGLATESVLDSWVYDVSAPGLLDYARRQMGSGLPQVWKEQYGYNATTRRMETMSTTVAGEASPWVTYQSYDPLGREQVTTYPSGLAVQRNYLNGYFAQLANATTFQGYWTASAQDAYGNITAENYGNGVYASHTTYASTGQYQYKRWYAASSALLDQFRYSYDSFGNLKQQERTQGLLVPTTVAENYQYDGLQRLTQSSRVGVTGAVPINTSYSPSGNLLKKSDNGLDAGGAYQYGYNGCGPHAVSAVQTGPTTYRQYGCDANGNVISGSEIGALYDFMNLPRLINRIGTPHAGSTQFRYDANGQRFDEVTGSGETTRFGPKGYEKVYHPIDRHVRHRHELGPVIITRQNGVDDVTYATRDRQGSLAAALPTNPYKGDMRSYDPYGNPRNGIFGDIGKTTEAGFLGWRPMTARGFTGHEHIDEGRVIHMNGRVFDYALGRFLGPDPIIQFPSNSQSLNPYSYIMNNPFAGTDPSGYAACGEVSVDQTNSSGSCDFTQNGKTSSISYSFNGKGDVAFSRRAGAASAGVSIGVLKENGADSPTAKGPSSAPNSSGVGQGADKIASSNSMGHKLSSIAAPNITAWGDRGETGTWGDAAAGAGKAVANTASALGNIALNANLATFWMPWRIPEQSIANTELGGAASVDVAMFAFSALKAGRLGSAAKNVDAASIRFSQSSVNGADEIAASMSASGWRGAPIDVVRMRDGLLTTFDNTRVLAASRSGIDTLAIIRRADEAFPAGRWATKSGVTPSTWGEAVQLRIQQQSRSFRETYPNGSPFTGASK